MRTGYPLHIHRLSSTTNRLPTKLSTPTRALLFSPLCLVPGCFPLALCLVPGCYPPCASCLAVIPLVPRARLFHPCPLPLLYYLCIYDNFIQLADGLFHTANPS